MCPLCGIYLDVDSAENRERHAHVIPLTVAIRVCCECGLYLGVVEWKDSDAHDGKAWVVTHGMCEPCANTQPRVTVAMKREDSEALTIALGYLEGVRWGKPSGVASPTYAVGCARSWLRAVLERNGITVSSEDAA